MIDLIRKYINVSEGIQSSDIVSSLVISITLFKR